MSVMGVIVVMVERFVKIGKLGGKKSGSREVRKLCGLAWVCKTPLCLPQPIFPLWGPGVVDSSLLASAFLPLQLGINLLHYIINLHCLVFHFGEEEIVVWIRLEFVDVDQSQQPRDRTP